MRIAFSLFLACLLVGIGCTKRTEKAEFQWETMGTVARCEAVLPHDLTTLDAQTMVTAIYDSVNSVFNTWRPDTEISRLNRAPADSAFHLSPWLASCLTTADRFSRLSAGAFDPTAEPMMRLWGFYRRQGRLPAPAELDSVRALLGQWRFSQANVLIKGNQATRFDLGAAAKGFAVDIAAHRLQTAGVENGLLDLGGNLFCLGGATGRSDWRVGVRDPLQRDRFFAYVTVTGCGVATSGSYERFVTIDGQHYGHIMNPATGQPAQGVLSATVFAPSALLADILSTTLFVLGPDAGHALLAKLPEPVEAILVVPGAAGNPARVLVTTGLIDQMTVLEEYADRYELVDWK